MLLYKQVSHGRACVHHTCIRTIHGKVMSSAAAPGGLPPGQGCNRTEALKRDAQ